MLNHPADWAAAHVALGGVLFFAALYLGFGSAFTLLTLFVLPRLGIGHPIGVFAVRRGQVRAELRASAVSVVIFGVGAVVPWALVKSGTANVRLDAPWWQVGVECLALFVWNDVHFYGIHRLLHRPSLYRIHLQHHRSVATTPWSTYAFHPIEAALLGSVLIPPMLVWDFSLASLLMLPAISIAYNSLGHANYEFLPAPLQRLSNATDHQLHHACPRGNYGFFFGFMDRWFRTALPAEVKAQRTLGSEREAVR